jgi:hypothetical protein
MHKTPNRTPQSSVPPDNHTDHVATSDLTFVTNERNRTLLDRFKVIIKDTQLFDVLVGYFYASGFHALYRSLENAEKIRILLGISTSKEVVRFVSEAKNEPQPAFRFSSAEVKEQLEESVAAEMEASEDNPSVEEGVRKFIEWLRSGKLEVRAYPTEHIHAKVYIGVLSDPARSARRHHRIRITAAGLLHLQPVPYQTVASNRDRRDDAIGRTALEGPSVGIPRIDNDLACDEIGRTPANLLSSVTERLHYQQLARSW